MSHGAVAHVELTVREIRARAASGVATVAARGIALRLMGLLGNVVLARLLVPRDFGEFAFAGSIVVFAGFLGDAGIGAALIRRKEPPQRSELGALLSLQALMLGAGAVLTAALAWPFGDVGRVTAVMALALPIAAFRTPGAILLERDLRYGRLVTVELIEWSTYYAFSIATVILGWGVWGLVTGSWMRIVAGSVLMTIVSPSGVVLPKPSVSIVRRLLGFGFRYQAVGLASIVRDQGLNLGTAAVAGLPALGIWSMAYKVLQLPYLLFDSLWRVSFPAMSRLRAAGENLVPVIERGAALAALVTGGICAVLVSGSPALIPAVLGKHWAPAVTIIPWAAAGLMISGPVSVATAGYLYAIGDATTVLRGVMLHTAAWMLVAFPLLPLIGIRALGIGWLAASLVEAGILGGQTIRTCHARIFPSLLVPALVAGTAATVGWVASAALAYSLYSGFLAVGVASTSYLVGMWILKRQNLIDVARVMVYRNRRRNN